ncbi:MAG: hypothetical protein ABI442_00315 [Gemmatimonadaceae bacterium]
MLDALRPVDAKVRLIVSQIILDMIDVLEMAYPKATPKHPRELEAIPRGFTT